MLYYLSHLNNVFGPLRLFEYVTFRAGGAAFTAMLLAMLLGPLTVRLLKKVDTIAPGHVKNPEDEADRNNVPCMGGILIVFAVVVASLLWNKPFCQISITLLTAMLLFATLGFADDFLKIAGNNNKGLPGRLKLIGQFIIAGVAVWHLDQLPETGGFMRELLVPFYKYPVLVAPWVMVVAVIVIVAVSNAVNLTDGKDGLAAGCVIFCALTYAAFAYLCGHKIFAGYLNIPFIPEVSEAVVFSAAIAGACIGFLWHNCYPASMFMGDTGSLALGGVIGLIAVLVRQELLFLLVGGVFVMEMISVIIQVCSFKLTGKRVFLCTPIHHHFERKGWTHTQIVVRFWILAGIFSLLALSTLKLR